MVGEQDPGGRGAKGSRVDGATLDDGWVLPSSPRSEAPAANGDSLPPAPRPPGTKAGLARTRIGLGDRHAAFTPKTSTAEGADDWLKALIGDVEPVSAPTSASALVLDPAAEPDPMAGPSGPPPARASSSLIAGAVPPPPCSAPPASDVPLEVARPVPPPSAPPIAKTGTLPRPSAPSGARPSTLPRPSRPPAASNRPAPARPVPPQPPPPSQAPAATRPSPARVGSSGAPPALASASESGSKVSSPPVALPRQERGQVTSGPSVVVSDGGRRLDAAPKERRGSRVGRWLWAAAVLGGLLVSGYRHDVIFGIAKAIGLGGVYDAADKSLFGGPVFGTVRSVDALVRAHPIDDRDVKLPASVTLSEPTKQ
jgi:hypothetical protein